ncbi:LysR family transcriptional regulator [Azoarcus sp. L1K30]|uniref:LysR family transcriptional regulator n=1 Tax=Azoarcus sp. L1K30 TaxID=2820277 RepID=UPI001B827159|nr:LysR family transcriptional regulator [Azoarcus sp. L1K30]MBR0567620.1 LysR family transcriptional regulator [Azoarcus sp. L1K30]
METLGGIECFVRSAEAGSFSEAARRLGLTSAAVGKNVARLESSLGIRLFQRSTRSLRLTEAGTRFLAEVGTSLATIQSAVANLADAEGQAAGTLKVSMGNAFGREHIVPLLSDFLARHPAIVPDWHFDNRQVDLIAEGFDAAIGGGFELPPGLVARTLAPAHIVLIASPTYLAARPPITHPDQLKEHAGIFIRSPQTGRIRPWALINSKDARRKEQMPIDMQIRMTMSDPAASLEAAEQGLGIAVTSMPNAEPYLASKRLVRVLPDWYADAGTLSLYFSAQRLLPAKSRAFIDFVVSHFREHKLAQRFSAY